MIGVNALHDIVVDSEQRRFCGMKSAICGLSRWQQVIFVGMTNELSYGYALDYLRQERQIGDGTKRVEIVGVL